MNRAIEVQFLEGSLETTQRLFALYARNWVGEHLRAVKVQQQHLWRGRARVDQDIGEIEVGMHDAYVVHGRDGARYGNQCRDTGLTRGPHSQPFPQVVESFGFPRDEEPSVQDVVHPADTRSTHFDSGNATLSRRFGGDDFREWAWWAIPVQITREVTHKSATTIRADNQCFVGVRIHTPDRATSPMQGCDCPSGILGSRVLALCVRKLGNLANGRGDEGLEPGFEPPGFLVTRLFDKPRRQGEHCHNQEGV